MCIRDRVAQYILRQLAAEVGIVALAVYRESVLHIKLLPVSYTHLDVYKRQG